MPRPRMLALALAALLLLALLGALARAGRAYVLSERLFHLPRPPVVRPQDLAGLEGGLEDVQLRSAEDGVVLRGWYLRSRTGAAVVLVHGLGQDRTALLPEARLLAARGYGVLLFDLRAHGESGGDFQTYGDRERGDVRAALDWVLAQPDVDARRVGALGFSIGASALAEVAAADSRVAAVALLCPYSTLEESIRSDFRSAGPLTELPALLPYWRRGVRLGAVRPIEALPRLAPRPVWLVAGTRETDIPMVQRVFAAAPASARTWWVQGAGHGEYAQAAPAEYARRLVAFFDAALGSSDAAVRP